MYLTAAEKAYLIKLGARIEGDRVMDANNNVATDADIKQLLDQGRAAGLLKDDQPPRNGAPKQKVIDAEYTVMEDSDDSENGYDNQRRYRGTRGSNRVNAHRSGYSAPQTRAETEDVDYGYIPTNRENRTARSKLLKEQRAAKKEERSQKQRKIRQYATNEMKYTGRLLFVFNEAQNPQPDRKFWIAIDYNPKSSRGFTAEAYETREEAQKGAERMRSRHGKTTVYQQKVAYTEPSNIKSNGSFKRKPASVYQLNVV